MLQAIRVAPGNLHGLDSAAYHKAMWRTKSACACWCSLPFSPALGMVLLPGVNTLCSFVEMGGEKTSFPSAAPWLQNKPVAEG